VYTLQTDRTETYSSLQWLLFLYTEQYRVVIIVYTQTFKYSILDAVPPIHGESYHVATDKDPSMPPSWQQVPVYF